MAKRISIRNQLFYKIISKIKVLIEEIFPFLFFYLRKSKLTKEVNANTLTHDKSYDQLSEDDLKLRITQEHERSKRLDDKTFKMTLAISFSLTIFGSTASLLIKEMPNFELRIVVAFFSTLSICYSMVAGFTAIGAL